PPTENPATFPSKYHNILPKHSNKIPVKTRLSILRPLNSSSDHSTDDDRLPNGFIKVNPRKTRRSKTDTTGFPPLPPPTSQSETSRSTASGSNKQPVPNLSVTSSPSTSQESEDTTAQPPRKCTRCAIYAVSLIAPSTAVFLVPEPTR
ncbi:unnamed protein product, partial [Acanthoscelides obtectus]